MMACKRASKTAWILGLTVLGLAASAGSASAGWGVFVGGGGPLYPVGPAPVLVPAAPLIGVGGPFVGGGLYAAPVVRPLYPPPVLVRPYGPGYGYVPRYGYGPHHGYGYGYRGPYRRW